MALRQRDRTYAKMFASDPAGYVQANIGKGDYAYWGFRGRKGGERMDWIPGITGRIRDLDRVDFVSVGLEVNDQTGGAAESFFRRYNGMLKKERSEAIKRGVKLDAYGKVQEGAAGDPTPGRGKTVQ